MGQHSWERVYPDDVDWNLAITPRPIPAILDEAELPEPKHVLVLGEGPTGGACLGLLVDRVVGLVDGGPAAGRGPGPVAERRPVGGRVVNVLDPEKLVARARQVIEHSLGRSE